VTPGSLVDRESMREAAILASVVVLYERGQRRPAAPLLDQPHPTGLLLGIDRYTTPWWQICLFCSDRMDVELLPRLIQARLERENGGGRLYGGIEVDGHQEHRQAWLCTPTPRRVREILLAMMERETGGRA